MIRAEQSGDLRLIWLDRPNKWNALTLGMIEGLRDLLGESAENRAVRGVILAGAGPSLSAGVDLREFANGTPDSVRRLITALAEACDAALTCPKPVAVAIRGYCLGGALELACACDFRVGTPDGRLGMPEVSLGIPSVIHAALIQRHIGFGRAQELMLTGDLIDAERALTWGLLNSVVRSESLLDACREMVGRSTRHDAAAIARQKRLHAAWLDLSVSEAIARSREELAASFSSGVPQQIARRRLEKR